LLTAPWNTIAPLAKYLRRAHRAGIERTVVFSALHSDYTVANREVARIVARHRGQLIGFAMLHPGRDASRVRRMVGEMVRKHGFRGVKVHGLQHMPTREVCDALREHGVPLLLDVAGKAHVIDMLASEYPDVTFIIAHLGSFADDWRAHERVVEQLARYPNVYADTSGVRQFDYLVRAVRRAGARKLMFGSDGPWLHPGLELHKIKLLGLPQDQEALILGGNARRLILGAALGFSAPADGGIRRRGEGQRAAAFA
jgi:uncharacterized protein